MRNPLKIAILLCSLSSLTIPQTPNPSDSKIFRTIEETVKHISGFALVLALIYPLEYIATYIHEYGHALPHIISGRKYGVTVKAGPHFLPYGQMTHLEPSPAPLLTTLLGPVAGIFAKYVQSGMIQLLHDSLLHKKSFSENFVSALKAPITIAQDLITKSEHMFSSLINPKQQIPKKKESVVTSKEPMLTRISKTLQGMLTISMFGEFVYGFLPNKIKPGEIEELKNTVSDGEKIWRYLLGSEPTFFIDTGFATIGFELGLVAIGAMKAIKKKYTESQTSDQKSDNVKKPKNDTSSGSKTSDTEDEEDEESNLEADFAPSSQ